MKSKNTRKKPKTKRVPMNVYDVDIRIRVELDHTIEVTARNSAQAERKALKLAQGMIYENRLLDGNMWDFGFEVQDIYQHDLECN